MNKEKKMPPIDKIPEGMPPRAKIDRKTLGRLFSYMKDYKGQLIFVVVCILLSAVASAASSLFLQSLIDDYITPLLGSSAPVFTGLLKALIVIGVFGMFTLQLNYSGQENPCEERTHHRALRFTRIFYLQKFFCKVL